MRKPYIGQRNIEELKKMAANPDPTIGAYARFMLSDAHEMAHDFIEAEQELKSDPGAITMALVHGMADILILEMLPRTKDGGLSRTAEIINTLFKARLELGARELEKFRASRNKAHANDNSDGISMSLLGMASDDSAPAGDDPALAYPLHGEALEVEVGIGAKSIKEQAAEKGMGDLAPEGFYDLYEVMHKVCVSWMAEQARLKASTEVASMAYIGAIGNLTAFVIHMIAKEGHAKEAATPIIEAFTGTVMGALEIYKK